MLLLQLLCLLYTASEYYDRGFLPSQNNRSRRPKPTKGLLARARNVKKYWTWIQEQIAPEASRFCTNLERSFQIFNNQHTHGKASLGADESCTRFRDIRWWLANILNAAKLTTQPRGRKGKSPTRKNKWENKSLAINCPWHSTQHCEGQEFFSDYHNRHIS